MSTSSSGPETFYLACHKDYRAEAFSVTQAEQKGFWRFAYLANPPSSVSGNSYVDVPGEESKSAQTRFIMLMKGEGKASKCPAEVFVAYRGTTLSDSEAMRYRKASHETFDTISENTGNLVSADGKTALTAFLQDVGNLIGSESGDEEEVGKK